MNKNDGKSKRIYSFLKNTNLTPGFIRLHIKGQDGRVVPFKINIDAKLEEAIKKYGERQQVDHRTLRFLYNEHVIVGRETPRELGLEDGATIDAMTEADGGGPSISKTA